MSCILLLSTLNRVKGNQLTMSAHPIPPSLLLLLHNHFRNFDTFFSISPRIYGAISVNILLFLASLIFTKIDTDPWQDAFYYLTLASALIFNSND